MTHSLHSAPTQSQGRSGLGQEMGGGMQHDFQGRALIGPLVPTEQFGKAKV